jgi:hypothetical protein
MHNTYDVQPDNSDMSKLLCAAYRVKCVVWDYWIPQERKAELFLLGAVFDKIQFHNASFDIVIYEDHLMILSSESASFAQLSE